MSNEMNVNKHNNVNVDSSLKYFEPIELWIDIFAKSAFRKKVNNVSLSTYWSSTLAASGHGPCTTGSGERSSEHEYSVLSTMWTMSDLNSRYLYMNLPPTLSILLTIGIKREILLLRLNQRFKPKIKTINDWMHHQFCSLPITAVRQRRAWWIVSKWVTIRIWPYEVGFPA